MTTHTPRSVLPALLADYLGMAIALALLIAVFSLSTEHFFSATTFKTIANQIPSAILIAIGVTYILIIAEIDLSVGSVLGLCSAVLGVTLVQFKWPLWASVSSAVATGLICGAFNGLVAMRWRLPSFIVTLGMLEMARGGAHFVTKSQTQYIGSTIEAIAGTSLLGLSLPFLFAIVLVVIGQLVLARTVFGRYLVAIGTNEEAVRLSGIDPRPIKVAVFLLSGLLVALAAIIDTSRFQSANPNAGAGYELQAIAAVVIGGTSLMGGRGSVVSSFFGVLIIAVLNSGLASVGAKDETKRLVTGLVIVAAVIVTITGTGWERPNPDMNPHIVVIGSLNADLVVNLERFPVPGESVLGRDFKVFPGGKGANQACGIARLGGQVSMVGQVGIDAQADFLIHNLASAGVDVTHIHRDPAVSSGVAAIAINAEGQNQIIYVPGANGTYGPAQLRRSQDLIASAGLVLLQLEIPLPTVEAAARLAKEAGALVMLDPAPAQEISDNLLSCVDYLTPNETELAILTHTPPNTLTRARAAPKAAELRARGAKKVIVKMGAQGALLLGPGQEHFWPAVPVAAVDTTAAGDAFNAAFAVALVAGQSELEAGRFAAAAAAFSVTRPGAQPSLPTRAEVDHLLFR